MNWIRFDKKHPQEDTTVMVSNGPAMGHYHYKLETYLAHTGNKQTCGVQPRVTIPLWDLTGKRYDVLMADIIQWSDLLPAPKREIKLTKWQRAVQKMKQLVGLSLFLFMPLYTQQPQSVPTTPVKKLKHYEHMRTQSMDESRQEILTIEAIKKQIEDKVKAQQASSRNKK